MMYANTFSYADFDVFSSESLWENDSLYTSWGRLVSAIVPFQCTYTQKGIPTVHLTSSPHLTAHRTYAPKNILSYHAFPSCLISTDTLPFGVKPVGSVFKLTSGYQTKVKIPIIRGYDTGSFISLGGICINSFSLDIALGCDPFSHEYVRIGDFMTLIDNVVLDRGCADDNKNRVVNRPYRIGHYSVDEKDKNSYAYPCDVFTLRKYLTRDDYKYILENLKLDFNGFDLIGFISKTIQDSFSTESLSEDLLSQHSSILMTTSHCWSDWSAANKAALFPNKQWHLTTNKIAKQRLTQYAYDYFMCALNFSKQLFGNFICEDNAKELLLSNKHGSSVTSSSANFSPSFNSKKVNTSQSTRGSFESRYHTYRLSGIPTAFLQALLPYGYMANRSALMFHNTTPYNGLNDLRDSANRPAKNVVDTTLLPFIGCRLYSEMSLPRQYSNRNPYASFTDALQSASSFRLFAMSLLDILRAKNLSLDFLFAINVVVQTSSGIALKNLMASSGLLDVLTDKITQKTGHNDSKEDTNTYVAKMVKYLQPYFTERVLQYESGMIYSRPTSLQHFPFSVFSVRQVYSAGQYFSKASSHILRGFSDKPHDS